MMTSAVQSPLNLRMRGGLTVDETWSRRGRVWILSDPLVREYYYLLDEEFELLQLLDGRTSAASLQNRFESASPNRRLDLHRLTALLARWHREGLVESSSPHRSDVLQQTDVLEQRAEEHRRRERRARWFNPLFFRLPGFDPSGLLASIGPALQWLFSGPMVIAACLLMASAILVVISQFAELQNSLPSLPSLLHPNQFLTILAVTAAIKVLHELGHAITCWRLGAQPKEAGILLMLGLPCLFVDVSDSWRLSRRRDRFAISAAGMYVELVLASIATWLWWFSQPGLFHTICLNVMLIGSLNTVLLNGNPLLRYDGYYLLSDALGIINLWSRSRQRIINLLESVCWGISSPPHPLDDRFTRSFLLFYGIASITYRWIITITILMLLHSMLKPWGLGWFAIAVAIWMLFTAVGLPMVSMLRSRLSPAGRRTLSRRSALTSSLTICGIVVACFVIPLPYWTTAPVVAEPKAAEPTYVSQSGRLIEIQSPIGSKVFRGDLIARLEDPELESQRLQTASELEQAEQQLSHLQSTGATDPLSRTQIPTAIARRDDLRKQLQRRIADLETLQLIASRDGVVLPVEPKAQASSNDELPEWNGQALDPTNLGCFLSTGTQVCSIGERHNWQAIAYVGQNELALLRVGLPVRLRWNHQPEMVLDGKVESIANVNVESVPAPIQDAIDLKPTSDGVPVPLQTRYQVHIRIDHKTSALWTMARGNAVISLPPQTVCQQLSKWIRETFHR